LKIAVNVLFKSWILKTVETSICDVRLHK